MARTVEIGGSDEVMAMFGIPGHFYRGKWQDIKITKVNEEDEDIPLEVRAALVGFTVPTIFSKKQIEEQIGKELPIPNGSRLAYVLDVVEILKSAGKNREANQLENLFPNPLDMYVFEGGIYELVPLK